MPTRVRCAPPVEDLSSVPPTDEPAVVDAVAPSVETITVIVEMKVPLDFIPVELVVPEATPAVEVTPVVEATTVEAAVTDPVADQEDPEAEGSEVAESEVTPTPDAGVTPTAPGAAPATPAAGTPGTAKKSHKKKK